MLWFTLTQFHQIEQLHTTFLPTTHPSLHTYTPTTHSWKYFRWTWLYFRQDYWLLSFSLSFLSFLIPNKRHETFVTFLFEFLWGCSFQKCWHFLSVMAVQRPCRTNGKFRHILQNWDKLEKDRSLRSLFLTSNKKIWKYGP